METPEDPVSDNRFVLDNLNNHLRILEKYPNGVYILGRGPQAEVFHLKPGQTTVIIPEGRHDGHVHIMCNRKQIHSVTVDAKGERPVDENFNMIVVRDRTDL
jgi:Leu/Phe-tRNA-protein transferase